MGMDHLPGNKPCGLDKRSPWIDEPTRDTLSLLEDALREEEPAPCADEHTDDVHSLLEENAQLVEENAQLRGLLARLSDLILKEGRLSEIELVR